jgi:superfamily II DNA or RNA helicase
VPVIYTPRDYQAIRIEGAEAKLSAGENCAIVLPTGTGKTKTALWTVERLLQRRGGGEVLWLVDKVALVDQTREAAAALRVPVTAMTVQSLKGAKPIEPGRFAAIVVDEAHGFLTKLRTRLLVESGAPLLGLTATPRRGDGRHISELFGAGYVGGPYTLAQAIEDGWCCDCKVLRVELHDLDLAKLKTKGRDYDADSVAEVMNVASHNEEIIKRWAEVAGVGPKVSNFFAANCAHANAIAAELLRQGFQCQPIHRKVKGARKLVQAFRHGEFRLASSVMMVAEGFDLPGLEVGVLARMTKSIRLLVQMLGRLLRTAEGKEHAWLLDCAGSYEGLDLASIYDAVAPLDRKERALTEPDTKEEFGAIPMLSDVISRVREIDLFRRKCKDARGGLPWQRVGDRFVLPLNGAWMVVAPSRHDPSKVAAALLYKRRHKALCRVVTRADDEAVAFAKASALARDSGRAISGEAKGVDDWFRDRGQPSDRQLLALDRHDIDGSGMQRGEAQAVIRKLHATKRWKPKPATRQGSCWMCRYVSFEEMAEPSDSHWCLLHDQSADDGCDDFERTPEDG